MPVQVKMLEKLFPLNELTKTIITIPDKKFQSEFSTIKMIYKNTCS